MRSSLRVQGPVLNLHDFLSLTLNPRAGTFLGVIVEMADMAVSNLRRKVSETPGPAGVALPPADSCPYTRSILTRPDLMSADEAPLHGKQSQIYYSPLGTEQSQNQNTMVQTASNLLQLFPANMALGFRENDFRAETKPDFRFPHRFQISLGWMTFLKSLNFLA